MAKEATIVFGPGAAKNPNYGVAVDRDVEESAGAKAVKSGKADMQHGSVTGKPKQAKQKAPPPAREK